MQELLLREEIFDKVLDGTKKSTSRKGRRDIVVGPLLFKMTEDESVQVVRNVVGVRYCAYKEITDDEARKEGYTSLADLQNILERIYGVIDPNELFTFIEWQ